MRAVKLVVVIVGAVALVAWWLAGDRDLDAPPPLPAPSRDAAGVDPAPPPVASLPESEVAPEPLAERAPEVLVLRVTTGTRESATPRARSAMAGVEVEAGVGRSYPANLTGPALAGGQSDAAGELVLAIPWEHVEAAQGDRHQKLWVRASVRGFLPRTEFQELPASVDAAPEFELDLQRGAQLEVLLLGPDGEPAAGRLTPITTAADGSRAMVSGASAGSDGRARLALRSEGSCVLFAEARSASERAGFNEGILQQHDLGTGVSQRFELRFDDPPTEVLEIRTRGPGSLRGRVTDARGVPVAGLELRGVAQGIPLTAFGVFGYDEQFERLLKGGGHLAARTRTDSDGRFELLGLRREPFTVHAVEDGETVLREPGFTVLTADPVLADGRQLELRFSQDYLALHVVHPDGRPYEERVGTWGRQWLREPDEWPETPRLVLAPLDGTPVTEYQRTPFLAPRATGPGEFAANVPTGRRYLVGILQREMPWAPQTVELPAGAGRVDVTLRVDPTDAPGELVVDPRDADGARVREALRLLVLDPLTGCVLLQDSVDTKRKRWPPRYGLPPGDYVVQVHGNPWIDSHHGTVLTRRAHGGFEQPVKVTSGEEHRVDALLGAGARLRVTLTGSADQSDVDAVLAEHPSAEGEWLEHWSSDVRLHLLRDGRWPTRPSFARYGMEGTTAAGVHLWSSLTLGSEATSELLTAGRATLVATLPGGRELRREVELFDGVTTYVTLDFR